MSTAPSSSNGPLITAGWHTLARVWDGQEVRQYVDGLRTNTTAVTFTGSWLLYRFGYQFTGSEALDEAYVPFFGAFGAAWDDAMVARWSANPLAMLWSEMDAWLVARRLRRRARCSSLPDARTGASAWLVHVHPGDVPISADRLTLASLIGFSG